MKSTPVLSLAAVLFLAPLAATATAPAMVRVAATSVGIGATASAIKKAISNAHHPPSANRAPRTQR